MSATKTFQSVSLCSKKGHLKISDELGNHDFKASNGLLDAFPKRYSIVFNVICGESAVVPQETVEVWKERLTTIIEGYNLNNIYNCDKTGLFFCALPDKTLTLKGEDCKGGKKSKDRLTAMLCCNASGSDLYRPLVIGKARKPCCFCNLDIRQLHVQWQHKKSLDDWTIVY